MRRRPAHVSKQARKREGFCISAETCLNSCQAQQVTVGPRMGPTMAQVPRRLNEPDRRSVSQDSLQRDPEGPSQRYASPGTQSRRSVSQDSLQRDPEGPSQPHASPGTQTMSLQCNLRRHLLHKSSKPATHKVRDTTSNMYKA
jgi:hypothetical protein